MSQPWDYIAKLVCIGDSGTGKSSVSVTFRTNVEVDEVNANLDPSLPFAFAKAAFPPHTMSLLELNLGRGLFLSGRQPPGN